MKKALLILSLVTAGLLGLDKIGVTPIAPGYASGFEWTFDRRVPSGVLTLRTDAGDVETWIRLTVRVPSTAPPSFNAQLSDGQHLSTVSRNTRDTTWVLEISKPGSGPAERTKFLWPSGIDVKVMAPANMMALDDWQLFLKENQSDSMDRARWRTWWFWISVVLLGLAAVGAFYGAQKEAKPRASAREISIAIVDTIQGESDDDTKRMRTLLEEVLDGTPVESAITALKLDPRSLPAQMLWFRAQGIFRGKLDDLMHQLIYHRSLVTPSH